MTGLHDRTPFLRACTSICKDKQCDDAPIGIAHVPCSQALQVV